MKQMTKTLLILAICAWTSTGTNVLNASNRSKVPVSKRTEVVQHRPRPEHPQHRNPIMNDRDFQFLYKTIKRKSFEKDKLELLSVGVLDNYFSCRQCIRIMSLYSFDKDRLKALDIMANHIVDRENAHLILDSFKFESDRRKAANILELCRR